MADGSLIFDTKIDNSGMDKGLTATEVKAKKAVAAVEKQTKVVQSLQAKLRELSSTPAKTEEYAKLEQSFQAADNKLQGLIDRQDKFLAGGGNTNNAAWKSLQYDIEKVADEVREYQAQMDRLKADGGAFTSQDAEIANVTQQLNAATLKAEELQVKAQEVGAELKRSMIPGIGAVDGLSKSFDKLGARISQTVKRVLIFSLLYKALNAFKGHMAAALKTNNEFVRALASLKGALLTAFQPIFNAVLPALITLLNVLTAVISAIARFFALLSGKGLKATVDSAAAMNEQADAIAGAGGAAEKASKQMADFDEINQLQDNSGGGGGGGGGSDAVAPDFSGIEAAADKFRVIRDLVLAIGAGLLTWKIASAFGASLKTAAGLALAVAGAILLVSGYLDAWKNGINLSNMLEMFAGLALLAGGLGLAFGPIAAGISLIAGGIALLVLAFKDMAENGVTIKNLTVAIAGLAAAALGLGLVFGSIAAAVALLVGGVALLVYGFKEWVTTGELTNETFLAIEAGIIAVGIALALLIGWPALVVAAIAAAALAIYQYWDEIKNFFKETWESIKGFFLSAWEAISGVWDTVAGWFSEKVIEPIKEFFKPLTDWFGTLFEGMWLIVQAIWKIVAGWFDEKVVQPIINFFAPIVEAIGGFFSNLWEDVKAIWESVSSWFSKYVTEPIQEAWETALGAISSFAKSIFNGIIGIFEGVVNAIISALNTFMSGFNALATIAGEIVGKDFSGFGQISKISIPRLAQGAVIPPNREFMAVLGDQKHGANIETPESLMRKIVREESGGGNDRPITIIMEYEGIQFGRAVYKANNREHQRVGVRLAGAYS